MSEKHHEKNESNLSSDFTQEQKSPKKEHSEVPPKNEDKTAELETKIAELKDSLIREIAEQDNLKKRHTKDLESTIKYSVTNIAKDLIEPFEQLFMALSVKVEDDLKNNSSFKSMIDGVEITRKSFEKAFEKHGLKRIYPKGEIFDHNLHQAVSQVKKDDTKSNTVIEVVQAGYTLHDRVVKPAMVVVTV